MCTRWSTRYRIQDTICQIQDTPPSPTTLNCTQLQPKAQYLYCIALQGTGKRIDLASMYSVYSEIHGLHSVYKVYFVYTVCIQCVYSALSMQYSAVQPLLALSLLRPSQKTFKFYISELCSIFYHHDMFRLTSSSDEVSCLTEPSPPSRLLAEDNFHSPPNLLSG